MLHRSLLLSMGTALLGLSTLASAQTGILADAPIEHSYPFMSSRAIASEPPSFGAPDLIYAGAGGGVYVLDASSTVDGIPATAELTRWTAGGETMLRTGGFVRDLKPFRGLLFAAAGIGGWYAWDKGSNPRWMTVSEITDIGDVRAIDAYFHDDKHWVLVGAKNPSGTGTLRLYTIDSMGNTVRLESVQTTKAITSIAVSTRIRNLYAVALVGTECGGLLRFDIPLSEPTNPPGAPYLSSPSATWNPPNSHFVRDVVLDHVNDRAFVASHGNGVYAFDLPNSPPGIQQITTGWPLFQIDSPFPIALTHLEDEGLLAVSQAPAFYSERQSFGQCLAEPCDCGAFSECDQTGVKRGVIVYDVGNITAPTKILEHLIAMANETFGISSRRVASDPDLVLVDVSIGDICRVYGVRKAAGTWNLLEELTTYDQEGDGELIVGGSLDDALILGDYLYVASEAGLATFDLDPMSGDLLDDFTGFELGDSHVLTGFLNPPARMYGSAGTNDDMDDDWDVMWIFDIEGANDSSPVPGASPVVANGNSGVTYGIASAAGLGPEPVPEILKPHRWVYVVAHRDVAVPMPDICLPLAGLYPPQGDLSEEFGLGSGIYVYSVGQITDGADAVELEHILSGDGITESCPSTPSPADGEWDGGDYHKLMGIQVVRGTDTQDYHAVYVSYGPIGNPVGEDHAGLKVYRVTADEMNPFQFSLEETCPAFTQLQDPLDRERVGQVTYDNSDGENEYLFVALGCVGVAVYRVNGVDADHFNPKLVGTIDGGGRIAWKVIRGEGNRIYITYLDDGIGVVDLSLLSDTTTLAASAVDIYRTRVQLTGITRHIGLPLSEQFNNVFVTEGLGGLSHVVFDF